MRGCLRVKTRQSAEAALDAFDELPANPLELSKGHFLFDDGRGRYHHFQVQILMVANKRKRTRRASTAAPSGRAQRSLIFLDACKDRAGWRVQPNAV